jgi:protein-tyrosine phosphatase
MVKILFVCHGNICRSPLAEGHFNKQLTDKGLTAKVACQSVGTANYHIGESPDKRAIKIAKQNGISLDHQAQQIKLADFTAYDYILVMDNENFQNVKGMEKKAKDNEIPVKAKVYLLREFDSLYDDEVDDSENDEAWEIKDPYYGTELDFQECYDTIERCNTEFLKYLVKAHKL